MRKFQTLLLLLVISNLYLKGQNLQLLIKKEFHHYKIDTAIRVVVLFKDNFYCLKSNKQIFTLNFQTGLTNEFYHDNSKAIGLENLYIRNDTLIGESRRSSYFLDGNGNWILLQKEYFKETPVLSDDNYVITSTCSGEWGGSLHFKNIKTNKIYECNCQCAVNVLKHDGVYIATASLSHMAGFANIFTVDDPLKLKLLNLDYLKKGTFILIDGKKRRVGVSGEGESYSKKGTKQLIDSIGITVASSFFYNAHQYFIVEKKENVSLSVIKNKKFISVEDLGNLKISSDYPINRVCGEFQVSTFDNDKNTGFIFIDKDKLVFYNFNRQ